MKKIFISLVLISLVIQVIVWLIPYYFYGMYSEKEIDILSWHGYGAIYDTFGSIPYFILAAYFIVSLGLIYFKSWAKPAFLSLALLTIAFIPFAGITVSEPIGGVFGYLLSLLDGSILTMLYFTSISNEFKQNT